MSEAFIILYYNAVSGLFVYSVQYSSQGIPVFYNNSVRCTGKICFALSLSLSPTPLSLHFQAFQKPSRVEWQRREEASLSVRERQRDMAGFFFDMMLTLMITNVTRPRGTLDCLDLT